MSRKKKLAIVLSLLPIAAVAALYRLSQDPQAMFALLRDRVEQQLGLQLSTDGPPLIALWPRPALTLRGVHLRAADSPGDLLSAGEVKIAVPWRALWTRVSTLGAASLNEVDIDAAAVHRWREAQAALGPPEPWRWPAIDEALSIHHARWHGQSDPPEKAVEIDVEPFALRSGRTTTLNARIRGGALPCVHADCTLLVSGVPENDAAGILLNAATLKLVFDAAQAGQQQSIEFHGELAYAEIRNWHASGQVQAAAVPFAAVAAAATAEDRKTDLTFRIVSRLEQRVDIDGVLAGSKLSAHFALAQVGSNDGAREWLQLLAGSLRGSAQIDSLEIDGTRFEGLILDDDSAGAAEQP